MTTVLENFHELEELEGNKATYKTIKRAYESNKYYIKETKHKDIVVRVKVYSNETNIYTTIKSCIEETEN